MPLLTFGIAWFGYALLSWGVATVRGCNVTFTQVAWPGKFAGCHPDGGGSTANAPAPAGYNRVGGVLLPSATFNGTGSGAK
jgi:hypothetical protein